MPQVSGTPAEDPMEEGQGGLATSPKVAYPQLPYMEPDETGVPVSKESTLPAQPTPIEAPTIPEPYPMVDPAGEEITSVSYTYPTGPKALKAAEEISAKSKGLPPGWRPNFNSPTPYAGMPPDYAGSKPTDPSKYVDTTVSPRRAPHDVLQDLIDAGAPLSAQIEWVNANPNIYDHYRAADVIKPVISQIDDYNKLSGVEQFKAALAFGFVPWHAKYVDMGEGKWTYIPEFERGIRERKEAREAARRLREKYQKRQDKLYNEYIYALSYMKNYFTKDFDVFDYPEAGVPFDYIKALKFRDRLPDKMKPEFDRVLGTLFNAPQIKEMQKGYGEYKRYLDDMAHIKDYVDEEGNVDVVGALMDEDIERDSLKRLLSDDVVEDVLEQIRESKIIVPSGTGVPVAFIPGGDLPLGDLAFNTAYKTKKYPQGIPSEWVKIYPNGIPSKIPDWLLSDEEYNKLSYSEKLALRKKGDLRAEYVVKTWAEAYERHMKRLIPKPPLVPDMPIIYGLDPDYQAISKRLKDNPKDKEAQADMKIYMDKWRNAALSTTMIIASFFAPQIWAGVGTLGRALTPALVARTPILSIVPRLAISLAQITFTATPLAYTGATINEGIQNTNLERKWDIFSNLSQEEKDAYARLAGYDKFGGLTEAEQANVLLHYSVPPGYTLTEWSTALQGATEALVEKAAEGAAWLSENAPAPISVPVIFAGGTVLGVIEGLGYTVQLPLITANMVDRVASGNAKEYAASVIAGMAMFFTTVIPAAIKKNPNLTYGRLAGLFFITPKSLLKLAKGLGVVIKLPKHILERGLAIEITTTRVPKKTPNTAAMKDVGTRLVKQLLEGKKVAEVKIGGGAWRARVRNVAWQRYVGETLYHFTTDMANYPKGKAVNIKNFYTSPAAAVRFGMMSAGGSPMKRPGLVAIHLRINEIPRIRKLLGKGEVELEAPFKDNWIDPIVGRKGTDVSANVIFGSYPIRHYKLRGSASKFEGLSMKQRTQVNITAAKDTAIDMMLGWHGRMQALKRKFGKSPQLKKVNESIKKLERETPEIIGKNGEIVRQRVAIPEPYGKGVMKSRVKGVILKPDKSAVFLAKDRSGSAWDLIGGSVDPKEILTPTGVWRHTGKVTWQEALASQFKGETDLGLRNIRYLDMYLGKIHEHALSGSRIFEGVATGGKYDLYGAWNKYQRYKFNYKTPELADAIWWDGTQVIEVYPAVYDILSALAPKYGYSMKNVKIYKGNKALLKARDIGFIKRMRNNKPIKEYTIKQMNQKEIAYLKRVRNDLLKDKPLTFKEWLNAENDFATITEIIKGRRRAVEIIRDAKVTEAELKQLMEHPELLTQKAWDILSKQRKGGEITPSELNILKGELSKAFDAIKKEYQKAFDKAEEEAYRFNPEYYNKRYLINVDYAIRVLRVGARRAYGDIPKRESIDDVINTYNRAYERYEEEPRTAVSPRIPGTYKIIYKDNLVYGKQHRLIDRYEEELRITPPRKDIPRVEPSPMRTPPLVPPPREVPPPIAPPEKAITAPDVKTREKLKELAEKGKIAWRQGAIRQGTKLRSVWYIIKYPYKSDKDVSRLVGDKPTGAAIVKGVGSAYKTIQVLTGKAPQFVLDIDLGIMDITLQKVGKGRTAKVVMKYKRDIKQRTRGRITISGQKALRVR